MAVVVIVRMKAGHSKGVMMVFIMVTVVLYTAIYE